MISLFERLLIFPNLLFYIVFLVDKQKKPCFCSDFLFCFVLICIDFLNEKHI
nr:MAG TPA: hypothetical protein [Bacteriophage sp.]